MWIRKETVLCRYGNCTAPLTYFPARESHINPGRYRFAPRAVDRDRKTTSSPLDFALQTFRRQPETAISFYVSEAVQTLPNTHIDIKGKHSTLLQTLLISLRLHLIASLTKYTAKTNFRKKS